MFMSMGSLDFCLISSVSLLKMGDREFQSLLYKEFSFFYSFVHLVEICIPVNHSGSICHQFFSCMWSMI